jgi:predicted amidophosphoribosyltransferase
VAGRHNDLALPASASNRECIREGIGRTSVGELRLKNKEDTPTQGCLQFMKSARSCWRGAFTVNREHSAGKSLLLFDDLYRSGATMNAVSRELAKTGEAKEVFVLALTHTRSSL